MREIDQNMSLKKSKNALITSKMRQKIKKSDRSEKNNPKTFYRHNMVYLKYIYSLESILHGIPKKCANALKSESYQ